MHAGARTCQAPQHSAEGTQTPDAPVAARTGLDIDVTQPDQFGRALRTLLQLDQDPGFRLRGPVAIQNRSQLFLVQASAYPAPVAIKAFFDPMTRRPEAMRAEAYFTALCHAREISRSHPGIAVVQPIMLVEALGVVAMEWIEGPTLAESILAGSLPATTDLLRKGGLWLATLHRSQVAEPRGLETGAMLAELREGADRVSSRLSSYATRVTDQLTESAADIAGQKVPSTLLHGDFKPDNLLVGQGRLVGIDLELCFVNAAMNDVAQFENHLYLLLNDPRHFRHARRTTALLEAFEAGYSDDGGMTLPGPPLAWARQCNALRLLLGQATGRNWAKALGAEWQIRALIRHLSRGQ